MYEKTVLRAIMWY